MRGTPPDRVNGTGRGQHAAAPARRRRFPWRTGRGRLIAGGITLLLIIIVVASGVVIGHHLASQSASLAPKPSTSFTAVPAAPPKETAVPGSAPSASLALTTDFDQLEDKLNADVGVVIGAVGSDQEPIVLRSANR